MHKWEHLHGLCRRYWSLATIFVCDFNFNQINVILFTYFCTQVALLLFPITAASFISLSLSLGLFYFVFSVGFLIMSFISSNFHWILWSSVLFPILLIGFYSGSPPCAPHFIGCYDSIRFGLHYVLITKVASVSSSSNFSNFSTLTYGWHDVGKMNVWLFAVATVSICCTDTLHTIRTHTNHIENRNGFLHTVFFFFLLLQTILNAPTLCHRLFSFDFLLYCCSQEMPTRPSVRPSI